MPAGIAYLNSQQPRPHEVGGHPRVSQGREARDPWKEAEARTFAEIAAPRLFRPDAIMAWRRWRAGGAKTIIVSASPDLIIAPFARGLGCDKLIASAFAFDKDDRVLGMLAGPNCRGPEKVRRLKEVYGEDVRLAAAYGDTSGDREMLRIADEKGYRVFKGRP